MVGDGAATLVARAFAARGIAKPDDALPRFLAIYQQRLTDHTKPYDGIPRCSRRSRPTRPSRADQQADRSTRVILERLDLARFFAPRWFSAVTVRCAETDPAGLRG